MPGSEYEVPCDTLIYAVGQTRTLEILPEGVELAEGNRTTHEKIFVTGDFHTGPLDVIHAVADAKEAAERIDEFLMGQKRLGRWVQIEEADDTGRLRDHDLYTPAHMRTLPLEQRQGNEEVELGYNTEEVEINARRCYLCNYKFEIDQDKCIHCDWCIKASPRACIHATDAPVHRRGRCTDRPHQVGHGAGRHLHLDRKRPVHPLRQLQPRLPHLRHPHPQGRSWSVAHPSRAGVPDG